MGLFGSQFVNIQPSLGHGNAQTVGRGLVSGTCRESRPCFGHTPSGQQGEPHDAVGPEATQDRITFSGSQGWQRQCVCICKLPLRPQFSFREQNQ